MPHKVKIQQLDDVDASAIGDLKILQYQAGSGKHTYIATPSGGGGATYYSASSQTDTAVTDNASYYDINALSISGVVAGTYLAVVDLVGNNKTGEVRIQITDGSNTGLWPTGNNWNTRHNTDNNIEFHGSGVIVLGSTLTVKVRGAAVSSVSNYHIYDRHLTLTKIA